MRQELGAEATNRIARRMVVAPQRDGGQAQFIDKPLPVAASHSLAPVTDWMLENLRADLSVEQLAARAHMSPRTFARRFKADLGATPAAWLARQRIIHAQRLLERTDLGLDRIAWESGFGSAAVLRQNFARVLGITPTAYRARSLEGLSIDDIDWAKVRAHPRVTAFYRLVEQLNAATAEAEDEMNASGISVKGNLQDLLEKVDLVVDCTPKAISALNVGNSATVGGTIKFLEGTNNGSNFVSLKSPNAVGSNLALTLPSSDGSDGHVLTTDGSGNLSFAAPASTLTLVDESSTSTSINLLTETLKITGGTGTDTITITNVGGGTANLTAATSIDVLNLIDYTTGADVIVTAGTNALTAMTVNATTMDAGETLNFDGNNSTGALTINSGEGADSLDGGTVNDNRMFHDIGKTNDGASPIKFYITFDC